MSPASYWFGSRARTAHVKAINDTPHLKCVWLCLLSYRRWQLARACDKALIHALREGDEDTFDRLLRHSDRLWASIYRLPLPDAPSPL